jgi:acyl carrier protein phosphodiesterase
MNYLAHAFLSNNDKDLLVGNFIADHLRGNDFSAFSPEIIKGIQLHRSIDAFTDVHPYFKKSKRLFYNGFEKHSGILVDIYFDHLLAKNFSKHSFIPLADFSKEVYEVYTDHQHLLPKSSSGFLDYVIKNNIYSAYADINGIERVLYHLSHRIKHNVELEKSIILFKEHETELSTNFDNFFKDALVEFSVI